jgi:hypothetical protein
VNKVIKLKRVAPVLSTRTLPIQTVYYREQKMVKKTRAGTANRAVPHAVEHMQINEYHATHCEVYDLTNGVLHAVLKRHISENSIEVLFKRKVKEGM